MVSTLPSLLSGVCNPSDLVQLLCVFPCNGRVVLQVGTAESKSAGTQGCCWDYPQAQSLLPAQVGAGSLLVGAWALRGLSVQQQHWRQAAARGWAGDAITPARTKSFIGSSVLCSVSGKRLEDKCWTGSSLSQSLWLILETCLLQLDC